MKTYLTEGRTKTLVKELTGDGRRPRSGPPAPLPRVSMRGKCTTCRKTFDVTEKQQDEAREMGCLFSDCCGAVATVERVEVR